MEKAQQQLIAATVPLLKANGLALTTHFYNRMFTHHPELKNLFNMGNQKNGKQATALAMTVLAYAEHIANPGVLSAAIDTIGHKHTSLDIRPEHYPIVGEHLLASIQEVLGDAATPEIIAAWAAAYDQLAKVMIDHESNLYAKQIAKTNGWTGWRPFRIGEKIQESEDITSFYLYPTDGGKVPLHLPGQYISLRLFLPQVGLNQARQYSISSAPNSTFYRISVKKEKGITSDKDGLISNQFHKLMPEAIVEVTAPAGNFTLPVNTNVPIVLISGGVGLTPLMSMLEYLNTCNYPHPVTWLHGCRNQPAHAFKTQLETICNTKPTIRQHVFYEDLSQNNTAGIVKGYVDMNKIPLQHHAGTLYFICGPAIFIQKQYSDLINRHIPKENIFFEEFGPQLLHMN